MELARNPKDDSRKYRQTMLKSVGATLHRAPSVGSDEDQHQELSRVEEINEISRKTLDDVRINKCL